MPGLKPLKIKAEDFHSLSLYSRFSPRHKHWVMTAPLITWLYAGQHLNMRTQLIKMEANGRVQSMGTGLSCNTINYHLMPLSQSCVGSPSVNNSLVVMRHNPPSVRFLTLQAHCHHVISRRHKWTLDKVEKLLL